MKTWTVNLLFWINYVSVILYMGQLPAGKPWPAAEAAAPLIIVSAVLADIVYITCCNVRGNKVIFLFCILMALEGWYMLLSSDTGALTGILFYVLCPVVWYVSAQFILMFLFQGDNYRFKKPVGLLLALTCSLPLVGLCLSEKTFFGLYGIQLFLTFSGLLFLMLCHKSRVAFVLKSERKYLLFSAMAVSTCFLIYYFATREMKYPLSNFGIYLPVLFFLISIHGIIWKEHRGIPLSTVYSLPQLLALICCSLLLPGIVILISGGGYHAFLMAFNTLSALFYLCNIIREYGLTGPKNPIQASPGALMSVDGEHSPKPALAFKESSYSWALKQLQQEETLKAEFADFLHNEILQDLLSLKNLMSKAERPEIRHLILETLDGLNVRIRSQMQDYHPAILSNLTVRENFQNLIEAVSSSFPQRDIRCSFECADSLFLVTPYHFLIYRLLRELLTNVYKHSDGNHVSIVLSLQKDIIHLQVSDNGSAKASCLTSADRAKHKGIASVCEQVERMEGRFEATDSIPHGICVKIQIPMKGDVSYQYFTN